MPAGPAGKGLLWVIEHVRRKGLFSTLELSYVRGPGCPEPFYRRLGFLPTGRMAWKWCSNVP